MTTISESEKALKARLAEGQKRHNIRLAKQVGATWLKGLDGYVISEEDLLKLIANQQS